LGKHESILGGANFFWHVVTLGNDITRQGVKAIIDGFTIQDGNAQGPDSNSTLFGPLTYAHSSGGGLYIAFNSILSLANCMIKNNKSTSSFVNGTGPTAVLPNNIGGGIYSNNSNISIYKCIFESNFAQGQAGALAIYNTFEESNIHKGFIDQCKFIQNTTLNFGGAIVVEGTFPNDDTKCFIRNSSFIKNTAYEGGAIVVDSEATFIDCCEFVKNIGYVNGGAVSTTNVVNSISAASQGRQPQIFFTNISNSIFRENFCTADPTLQKLILMGSLISGIDFPIGGGALVCYINGRLNVNHTKFINNTSLGNGGAIINGKSAAGIVFGIPVNAFSVQTNICDCEFIQNKAVNGGAIASEPDGKSLIPPIVVTVTDTVLNVSNSNFIGNIAKEIGGAIYLVRTLASIINNCFRYNQARSCNNIYKDQDSMVVTSQCHCYDSNNYCVTIQSC
jgi:hypothetical protein